jgi:hypothetical protein
MFAPNNRLRQQVTPARRGQQVSNAKTKSQRGAAMTPDQVQGRLWAQRLKRAFKLDIEICGRCGCATKHSAMFGALRLLGYRFAQKIDHAATRNPQSRRTASGRSPGAS